MNVEREPFHRRSDGSFTVWLAEDERDVLRGLTSEFGDLLRSESQSSDPAVARLFPAAYPDDALRNLDYDRAVHDDLLAGRLAAVAEVERTVGATGLSEDEFLSWLAVINDLRLVMGARMGLTEDLTEEDLDLGEAPAPYRLYAYLTYLVGSIVEALGDPTS